MEKKISKQLGNLISQNLDLDLFWSISFDTHSTRMIGDYSKAIKKYLLKKSFNQKDYLYSSDKNKYEFEKGSIRILLYKKIIKNGT